MCSAARAATIADMMAAMEGSAIVSVPRFSVGRVIVEVGCCRWRKELSKLSADTCEGAGRRARLVRHEHSHTILARLVEHLRR
jgi:hypothetical protein